MNDTTKYTDWISANVDEHNGYGKCRQVVESMANEFPELEIRKGLFHSLAWGDREHWWLRERKTGLVVDPTGRQHPDGALILSASAAAVRYTDLTDKTDDELREILPSGRCPNCGDDFYGDGVQGLCSEACASSYAAYIERESRRW